MGGFQWPVEFVSVTVTSTVLCMLNFKDSYLCLCGRNIVQMVLAYIIMQPRNLDI